MLGDTNEKALKRAEYCKDSRPAKAFLTHIIQQAATDTDANDPFLITVIALRLLNFHTEDAEVFKLVNQLIDEETYKAAMEGDDLEIESAKNLTVFNQYLESQ